MQAEPPQQPPPLPVVNVNVPIAPIPQTWALEKAKFGDTDAVLIVFTSPLHCSIAVLDRGAAMQLSDKLREVFSGVVVADATALRLIRDADGKAGQ